MAELGVAPHVVEATLNHVSGHKAGVAGIYNRATYEKEKRAALVMWAEHVLAAVEDCSVTVVPKHAAVWLGRRLKEGRDGDRLARSPSLGLGLTPPLSPYPRFNLENPAELLTARFLTTRRFSLVNAALPWRYEPAFACPASP
jgi:hypothetical protein